MRLLGLSSTNFDNNRLTYNPHTQRARKEIYGFLGVGLCAHKIYFAITGVLI